MGSKASRYFIIGTFVGLYVVTSILSTIHVVDFFRLSNPEFMAISLAVAFEIGAAASLAAIITLEKMNKGIVWSLFILLTCIQAMGNAFHSYTHLHDYQPWMELFGLMDEEPIFQKRVLSVISGAVLPLVALGFIKSLVDYLKPVETVSDFKPTDEVIEQPFINDTTAPQIEPDQSDTSSDQGASEEVEKITNVLDKIKVFQPDGTK